MSRPRRAVGAASLGLLTASLLLMPIPAATAQTTPSLDLVAQTLFLDDEPAEIVLRITDAPEGARLRFTVYDNPALTRAQVREQHRNPPTTGSRIADFECTLEGDCREQATMTDGPDGIRTVTLDELVGESLRSKVGALPLVVQLLADDDIVFNDTDDSTAPDNTAPDKNVLDEVATSLIVLEDAEPDARGPQQVQVAFTSQVIAPVALQADLRTSIDADALLAAATPLAAHPELPVTTEIRPETLEALDTSDPAGLRALLEIIGDRPLIRGPWVDMDEEAWRLAGESDQVVSQYAIGNDTVERVTGAPPTGLIRLDDDAGPATLTLLRSAGATAVLADDDQLSSATRAADPTQPFQLLDTNGVAITALRYDEELHETLDDDDPELAAYRAIAELVVLAEEASTARGVVLDLARIDSDALDLLLDGIAERRALRIDNVADLTEGALARVDGETLRGELVSTAAADVSDLAAELESATIGLATVARMVEPETQLLDPLISQLQAAVSADLDLVTAHDYVERVDQEIRDLTAGIEIPTGDRITLTDRRTDLPLTIINRQSLPLNVELLLTAEKIRFPEGNRLSLVLRPGENPITIPVETLASGDARVTATIVSPGGFFELGSGTVDIRSTAISGLGLLISIAALIVLGVWWIRTILHIRRNRHAATVSAESAEEERATDATPTEGES